MEDTRGVVCVCVCVLLPCQWELKMENYGKGEGGSQDPALSRYSVTSEISALSWASVSPMYEEVAH